MHTTRYALTLLSIVIASALSGVALGLRHEPPLATTPPTGQWFDYVVNVMLENHSINFTYYNGGSVNSCIGNCTYYTSLANANGLALQLTNGMVNASTASYIAMTSGYGKAAQECNSGPNAAGCPYLQILNIVDRLESSGLSWKAYMEGYPQPASGCFTNYNSAAPFYYTPNHNPFLYYADIVNNTARCARIVSANSQPVTQNSTGCWPSAVQTDDVLIKDLNSVSNASNYMWLTPNTVDGNHDCNDVSIGNAWLNKLVPQILGSTLFKTKRAALFVTFDEPGCTNPAGQPPCPSPPSQAFYSVWASSPSNPTTRSGFKSTQAYLLYSPLKAVESNWGLATLTANDAASNNMAEFFAVLSASFIYSPSSIQPGQQVTFTATATGGASPYTFNWRFGDGGTAAGGTVTHAYSVIGVYNAQLTVIDKLGVTKNVTQSITVGPNFIISSSPSSLVLRTGSSNTSRITVSSINSFSGSVTLTTSVAPSGLTASLNVTLLSLTSGGNASAILTVSSTTPATYTVNVTGTSGSSVHTTTLTVRVVTTDFSISASPTSLTIAPSTPGTSTIQLTSLSLFSGTISLSATVSQPGLVSSLSPATITLASGGSITSTLTLSSLNYGNYTVTVIGTSGSLSHSAPVAVRVFPSSIVVAPDSASGTTSLYTPGGQKLIQDSAGKMIAIYVDSSGRISLSYDNADPTKGGWSTPVKSSTPAFAYSWPAAVLVSLTSLRIIAVGGSVSGGVVDIPVTISRTSGNNVTGFSFGSPTILDSSGLGKYTAAILLHNNGILAAWGWENTTRAILKSLRWDQASGWTGLSGASTIADNVLVDASVIQYFVPNMIERPDNQNIYVLANRFVSSGRVAFVKASWSGSGWSWGSQNLTYETNASDADDDAVGLSWDPTRSLVIAEYGISGTRTYGVFTLTATDLKTHIDTPTLAVTGDRGWGAIGVQTNIGDYYLFLISVNSDAGSGTLGYIRMPSGGQWNATITWLNTAADNQVTSLRATGPNPSLDLLYVEGTTTPATLKLVRIGAPSFTLNTNPIGFSVPSGTTGTSLITVTSLYNFAGTTNLSATVAPSGTTATLTPAVLTLTSGSISTSTLSFTPTSTGTYNITIVATSGLLTISTSLTVTVVDFQIASSQIGITVISGALGSSTITLTSLNGLTGTVTLSFSASSPSGLTCTLPASITFGSSPQTATLSCSSTTANTYTVTVTGTDGTLSHTTTAITFTVVDFSIAGGGTPAQVLAATTGTSTITVTALNSLTGTVALTVSASTPAGLNCTLSSTSVTFGTSPQTSTLSCSSGSANTYTVTITGIDGALSHTTAAISFKVVDFTIAAGAVSPSQILAGASATSTITLTAANGLVGSVALTLSPSTPSGMTCTLTLTNVALGTSPQTSTLSCTSGTANTYTMIVTGTDGTLAHATTAITFVFVDFTINAGAVSPVQIFPGSSGTSNITITGLDGLTGTVISAVSASTPGGLTCTLPTSVAFGISPQIETLSCSATVAGDYAVTITGTIGTLSHTTPSVLFHIVDFSISNGAVAPIQILAGTFGTSTITVNVLNGLTGTVSLAVSSSSPAGLACALPASVTFGTSPQTSILSCSATLANTYTVTVTGTDGTLSRTTAAISFVVVDFRVNAGTASPTQILVGSSGSSTITVTGLNGLSGTVALTVLASTPAGLTCSLTPTSVTFGTSPQTARLTCGATSAGTYTVTVSGTDASLSRVTAAISFTIVDFTINNGAVAPAQIPAGASGSSTVTLAALNGLTGTVNLAVSTSTPAGLTCTLPANIVLGASPQTTALSCSAVAANTYNVTITGTDGALTHTTGTITFVVADFAISAGTGSPTQILVGASGNSTVTVSSLNGLSGIINLSLSASTPAGLTCTLPATVTLGPSQESLNLSCASSTANTYTLTVSGTTGTLVHTTSPIIFVVVDFSIASGAVSPSQLFAGATGNSTVTLTSLNGFTGTLNLATNGTSCALSSVVLIGQGSSVLSCNFASARTISVTVTGTSGSLSHQTSVTFTVQDFTIASSLSTVTVFAGSAGTSTIIVSSLNGFSGTVTLATNSTSCAMAPAFLTSPRNSTVSCSFTTVGTISLVVTGVSSLRFHSTILMFVVQDYNLNANPTTLIMNVGAVSTSVVTIGAMNGFSSLVSLTTNSTACSVFPVTITGSGTANVSCGFSSVSTTHVKVIGQSSSLSHSTLVVFIIQDFSVTTGPPGISIVNSASNSTVTVNALNGFSGTVNLSEAIPQGMSCIPIAPGTLSGSGTALLSCSSATPGNYTLAITATSTNLAHTTILNFVFQDYSLLASQPSASSVDFSIGSTITITSLNGFSGTVILSDTLSSGLSCNSITPTNITRAGRAVISCSAAVAGNYTLAITSSSTTLTHSTTVTLAFSDFSITLSVPSSTPVGRTASSTINVASVNRFSGTVFLSEIAPPGLRCLPISPTSITGSGTAVVTCTGSSSGNYTLQVLGAVGSLTRTASVIVQISDYSISASPTMVTSQVGSNASFTISVTSLNGYSGTVQATALTQSPTSPGSNGFGAGRVLILASLPPSLNFTMSPSSQFIIGSGTGLYVLTVTIPLGMQAANYTITITANDGQLSHTTQATLMVTDFSFSTLTSIVSLGQGTNTTRILTLLSLNGFRSTLSISSTTNPVGPITGLNPSSLLLMTGANITLIISIPSTLQPGNYTLTILATTGTLSHSVFITVQVRAGTTSLLAILGPSGATTTGIAGLLTLVVVMPLSIRDRHDRVRRRGRNQTSATVPSLHTESPTPTSQVFVTSSCLPFPISPYASFNR